MIAVTYPRLARRVRAALVDSVLLPVAIISALILGNSLGVSSLYGKVMLVVLPILILEPGLVALTGGTIGHHLFRIRVVKHDGTRNINILAATVRFVVKLVLGWLSFILILTTSKHQAVHDWVAGSIVIHKDATGLPAYEVLSERVQKTDAFLYPPAWRRVVVIVAYWVLVTVGLIIASYLISSAECAKGNRCTTVDYLLNISLNIAWLVGVGWVTVRGWGGRLPGCKRRPCEAT